MDTVFMGSSPALDSEGYILKNYTYKGLWQDFHEPSWKQRKWTVTTIEAIIIFALFSTFLSLTQGQSWTILRACIQKWRPSVSDGKKNMSQSDAMVDLAKFMGDLWMWVRVGERPLWDSVSTTPLFGVAVGLNALVFITMGLAIPYAVSEGALGAPLVRTRATHDCLNSTWHDAVKTTFNDFSKDDAIFQQCLELSETRCDNQFFLSEPSIEEERIDDCPFHPSLCLKGHQSIQLTHNNITPFEMGVNSKHAISITHRLTCSPVDLNPFMVHGLTISGITLSNNKDEFWANHTMVLSTHNGPNDKFPDERSGYIALQNHGLRDITVLPEYFSGSDSYRHPEAILPELRREDGHPFLIVYRAGHEMYRNESDDPLFSAHYFLDYDDDGVYASDFEATGLGCVEQFRFCALELQHCTDWGPGAIKEIEMIDFLETQDYFNLSHLTELDYLFTQIRNWVSVFEYLAPRTQWFNAVPLRTQYKLYDVTNLGRESGDQWTKEVKTWFDKANLRAIIDARYSARLHTPILWRLVEEPYTETNTLCGKILFRHPDYTNIYWVGFWAAFSGLMLVWVVSTCIAQASTITNSFHCVGQWIRRRGRIVRRMKAVATAARGGVGNRINDIFSLNHFDDMER
ncbi:hypothetical protein EDB80DRAFT_688666 [Ilyonectria destructans]|nr:hypothetical protein EDB80DRAFT_688666 [Ilyonectria destructans]